MSQFMLLWGLLCATTRAAFAEGRWQQHLLSSWGVCYVLWQITQGAWAGAGQNRAVLSSQSLRSVVRGSMGLNPTDPLLRQNEEVLQVRQPTPCFHLFRVNAHPPASF